jgi:hypothetical protein
MKEGILAEHWDAHTLANNAKMVVAYDSKILAYSARTLAPFASDKARLEGRQ